MAVDVRVDGVAEWNASDITVSEDSTPLDPSDSFGGVGAVSFTIPEGVTAKWLLDQGVTVEDSQRGVTQGVVEAVAGRNGQVTVEALTRLAPLVAERTAAPHIGTLESVLLYYFGLCGVTTGVVIDASIGSTAVVAPGWYGNVWEQIKKLAAAYRFEVAVVGGDIVARPPRTVTAPRERESAFQWSLDKSRLAQTVEAWYYPCAAITDALVVGNELSPISNLEAGEVHEFDVQLEASLSSVQQPVCMDSVSFDAGTASVYSVVDANGAVVDADYWRANGGYVHVEISDDTRSLHVTVVGCQERARAPYKLAGVTLGKDEYSTLRIVGTGVSLRREKYVLPAAPGADAAEVGAEVDNHFLGSWGHAHLALLSTAGRYGVPAQRLSVAGNPDFGAQTYGNVAGARVFEDSSVYRIRTALISRGSLSYEAEPDVVFDDISNVNNGCPIAEWNAEWEGRPISEFNLRPLTPVTGGGVPTVGLYPGATTFPSSTTFPGA